MAVVGLIGVALGIGLMMKALKDIDGVPHKLEKVYSNKTNADKHVKQLKKSGKKAKVVEGTDIVGDSFYGVYTKIENKKKTKKKK